MNPAPVNTDGNPRHWTLCLIDRDHRTFFAIFVIFTFPTILKESGSSLFSLCFALLSD